MTITRRNIFGLTAAAAALVAAGARAAEPRIFSARRSRLSLGDQFAIRGTDPVAYFSQGRPVEGVEAFTSDYMGATWAFASAENKALFDADPSAYAPQYGGYCAYAVSQGYTAPTVPEAWHIEAGKLYLNFSLGVQRRWRQDIPGNIAKGDANWPSVLG